MVGNSTGRVRYQLRISQVDRTVTNLLRNRSTNPTGMLEETRAGHDGSEGYSASSVGFPQPFEV